MAVYIKNGTPKDGPSCCASCIHAHILRGFRESEEAAYCDFSRPMIPVPFKVRECSNYADKNRPDWEQMEKLAIDILPISSAKTAGFRVACETDEEPEEVEVTNS